MIVLRYAFPDLSHADSDGGIGGSIVVCGPSEDLHSEHPLLQELAPTRERLLHHVAKQGGVAAAVAEERTAAQPP